MTPGAGSPRNHHWQPFGDSPIPHLPHHLKPMKRRNEKRGLTVLTSSTFPPDNGGKQALVLADLIIPSPPLPWPRAYHHHQYIIRYHGARLPSSLRLRTFFSMLMLPITSHSGRAADCQFRQVTFLATKSSSIR